MFKKLRYLYCLLLLSFSLFGQNNHFINVNREDGLASNFVRAIHQDTYGYMWFGTDNGLNRFDGIQMDTYRHSFSNEFSLSDNNIHDIFQTSSGKLLICTSVGIDVFDYNTAQFKHINFIGNYDLKKIIETADHNIWVVTNNNIILVLDPNLNMLNPIDLTQLEGKHSKLSNNLWTSIYDENSLALYDVSSGFYLLDINTRKLTLITSNTLPKTTTIFKIHPINNSEFWVTTLNGVFICKNGTFSKRFTKGDTTHKKNLTSNFVLDLKKMPNNEIWLFTDGGGINIYNITTKQFRYIENNIDDSYSLGSNFIYTTFLDKNATLWLGTIKNGVSQLDSENPFTTYKLISHDKSNKHNIPAASLFLDSKNHIWVGSDGNGLYKLENNIMQHVYFDKNIKTIPSINETNANTLILGTYKNGISTFNSRDHKLTKQTAIDQHLDLNTKVTFIEKDNDDGSFWVGGDHILNFDPVKKQQIFDSNTPLNAINLRALSFKTHSKDTLLFGGIFGLYQYDNDGIKMVSNIPNYITSIIKNKQSTYWLATNKGLCLFDLKTRKTTFYNTASGININKVNSLIKDDSNNVWMGTGQGISKFDIHTKIFSNYTYKDGFADNSFNRPIVAKNKEGQLYFGGIKGVLTFHPDSIKPTATAKKVLFTKILVNHEEFKSDKKIGLQQAIEETTQLVLNYSQKILTINFSSFDFKHPEKVHFLYKLEGYDKEWQSTTKRSLTYMNLAPKEYMLKIKASNISNQWSDSFTSLNIQILPAWWQTYWFKLIVLFSFLFIIYIVNQFLLKKEQAKRLLEFEKKSLSEQKDLDEKQLRFFTNLSHEVRTPLSLILSPVENIIKEDVSPTVKNNLALIQKNALRIERLINRVIDFRKTQFKEPEIQASKKNIVLFLKEIANSFSSFSKSKNIALIVHSEVDTLFLWFDNHMMETIFFNLLSNAFKYSHSNGKIIVHIFSDNEQVCIKVQDSGKGIAAEDLTHIFERFYQSKNHIGGSGIGLALTKRFVEAHKGSIKATSTLGEGSTFKVCFPLGNTHFDKSNLVHINQGEKRTVIAKEKITTETVYNSELKNNTILIVEDEVNLRDYLSTNLSHNYHVITAGNGKEGLQIVKTNHIDLIVSDIMMPEMNGIELCKLLKENVKTCNIPIILLTAKALKEDKIKGYDTGADAYLEKPFQLDYLNARINNLLESQIRQKNQLLDTLNISVDDATINNSDQEFYKQSIAIIQAHISNPDFNIPMFTKELGMSKSLVYKKMSKITTISVNDLILSVRLQRASQMLIHTKKSIVEISLLVGFKNSKYFSTSFKKKFKLSPSSYRIEKRNLNNSIEE